jgi:hypothetical protein
VAVAGGAVSAALAGSVPRRPSSPVAAATIAAATTDGRHQNEYAAAAHELFTDCSVAAREMRLAGLLSVLKSVDRR